MTKFQPNIQTNFSKIAAMSLRGEYLVVEYDGSTSIVNIRRIIEFTFCPGKLGNVDVIQVCWFSELNENGGYNQVYVGADSDIQNQILSYLTGEQAAPDQKPDLSCVSSMKMVNPRNLASNEPTAD